MQDYHANSGVVPYSWLQHHLPWLGLLALFASLFRDDKATGFDLDDKNG